MSEILMIKILNYQASPPSVSGTFWWSIERGVTCDNPCTLARSQREGILISASRRVYPMDGRIFFDALPLRYTGLRRAQAPILVDIQEGEALNQTLT